MSPVSPQNLLRHELIGLKVKVANAVSRQLTGLTGRVVNETRNTLTLSNGKKCTIVPKGIAAFNFHLPTGEVVQVEGKRIVGRPEDRVKMRVRHW